MSQVFGTCTPHSGAEKQAVEPFRSFAHALSAARVHGYGKGGIVVAFHMACTPAEGGVPSIDASQVTSLIIKGSRYAGLSKVRPDRQLRPCAGNRAGPSKVGRSGAHPGGLMMLLKPARDSSIVQVEQITLASIKGRTVTCCVDGVTLCGKHPFMTA